MITLQYRVASLALLLGMVFLILDSCKRNETPSIPDSDTLAIDTVFDDNYFEEREAFLKSWKALPEEEKKKRSREYKVFQRQDAYWSPRLQGSKGSIKEFNYHRSLLLAQNQQIWHHQNYTPCKYWKPIGLQTANYGGTRGVGRLTRVKFHLNYSGTYAPGVVPPISDRGANTFYAASPTGGLWKSEDGGQNWSTMRTDFLPFLGVANFVQSTKNSDELYILSSSVYDRSKSHEGPWGSMAVFKTADGGVNWESCGAPFSTDWSRYTSNRQYAGDLALIEPPSSTGLPDYLMVVSELGVHFSHNNGQTWINVLPSLGGNCSEGQGKFEPDPNDAKRIYLSSNVEWKHWNQHNWNADSIYFSDNYGGGWNVWQVIDKHGCGPGLTLDLSPTSTSYIASNNVMVSPQDPNKIYLLVHVNVISGAAATGCYPAVSAGWLTYLFKTTDRGATWTQLMRETTVSGSSYPHFGSYAINPLNDEQIFLGRSYYVPSQNLSHWDASAGNFSLDPVPSAMHADLRHLVLKAVPRPAICGGPQLYALAGTDGGLNLCEVKESDLRGGGNNNWSNVTGTGLQVGQIYNHASSSDYPYVTFGAADIGSWVLDDPGWYMAQGGDGMDCDYDSQNNLIFYNSDNLNNNIRRHTRPAANGPNIRPSSVGAGDDLWTAPITLAPGDPNILFAGYDYSVYRNSNGPNFNTSNWDRLEIEQMKNNGNRLVATIGVSPVDPDVIFAASHWSFNYSDANHTVTGARLFRTTNGGGPTGKDWVPTGSYWTMFISGIAIAPNGQDVFVSNSGHEFWSNNPRKVMYSPDLGNSWVNWSDGLYDVPINCIAVDPVTKIVYCGTDYGVYYRKMNAPEWKKFGCGLPNVVVTDLSFTQESSKVRYIRASTFGRGMWEARLTDALSIPPEKL